MRWNQLVRNLKNVNWSLLLYRIPKLRNKTWNWVAERKTKRWVNQKLKYNCNQQCINSIAAEFPTEIHCNFLSFSSIGKSYRFSATEIYTLTLVAIAELKTKRKNLENSKLWKKRNCAQKNFTETEFNTQNRNVTLNWNCKTELCAEIHSNGIIKTWIDHS